MSADALYEARFAAAAERNDGVAHDLRIAAQRLQAQAAALQAIGFEGALEATISVNSSRMVPLRSGFPKPPLCCALEAVPEKEAQRGRPYRCAPGGDTPLPADYKYPE